jgi:hypothetical protein
MVTLLENLNLVKMLEGLLQALYVFFMHSSKKFLETCWLNQYQGQQIVLEHQNVLDFYPFSNKMHVCRITLVNYQNACQKFQEQGCFQEHAYFMWHWIHHWAPLYPSYAWMCPCSNQNCTKLMFLCVILWSLSSWPHQIILTLLWSFYQVWGFDFWWFSI